MASPFQSPLHRGTLFNSRLLTGQRAPALRFSPLFIGELSSTPESLASRGRRTKFQSPLHRGTLFNSARVTHGLLARMFQSPLHRGTLFNGVDLQRTSNDQQVSVPSSSGNSLQPWSQWAGNTPPIVSVPSSSGKSLQRGATGTWALASFEFQSPLHRGTLFNAIASAVWKARSMFQSPLHRGTLFNLDHHASRADSGQVSVPSSSGNSLQPLPPNGKFSAPSCFSPLFIGELSSTTISPPAGYRLSSFQSPLHGGTLFNEHHGIHRVLRLHVSVPSSSGSSQNRPSAVSLQLSANTMTLRSQEYFK